MIDWQPMFGPHSGRTIDWSPLSVAPRAAGPEVEDFPLVVRCRTADERAQIAAELTKHGIKCHAAENQTT